MQLGVFARTTAPAAMERASRISIDGRAIDITLAQAGTSPRPEPELLGRRDEPVWASSLKRRTLSPLRPPARTPTPSNRARRCGRSAGSTGSPPRRWPSQRADRWRPSARGTDRRDPRRRGHRRQRPRAPVLAHADSQPARSRVPRVAGGAGLGGDAQGLGRRAGGGPLPVRTRGGLPNTRGSRLEPDRWLRRPAARRTERVGRSTWPRRRCEARSTRSARDSAGSRSKPGRPSGST